MNLPLIQAKDPDLMQVETKWKSILDPIASNPILAGRQLSNVSLVSGNNVINHGLGRNLQGYFVVMNSAAVTFYDKQSTNNMPQLTLELVASGATTVSLWVY